jgi:NTP pyrophosphatase (non-canonical NTP hydrolase)
MITFKKTDTIADFQRFIEKVYALPDDRLYSIWDLLNQAQRFTMRSLKGIRKQNTEKTKTNLLIALSWMVAITNRLHIDIEEEVWNRFPYLCSYCGVIPCSCKSMKTEKRVLIKIDDHRRPHSLGAFQKMFAEIYPSEGRTPADGGVHLAEEMGEVSEAMHNYMGQHQQKQFAEVKLEISDFVSCLFGVANSLDIDVAKELALVYSNGCHVCHRAPCECTFSEVVSLRS